MCSLRLAYVAKSDNRKGRCLVDEPISGNYGADRMATVEITANSTMQEVLDAYPGAQRALMRGYHIGGCGSCGFAPGDRLSEVLASKNVLNEDEVIEFIKRSHKEEQRIQIDAMELAALLKAEAPPKLIDVREAHEQELAHIEGSIPATQKLFQEMVASWAKDTPIVTYCHIGFRSLEAASYLIGQGFTDVRSLVGGINAWAKQIEPSMARY